MKSFARRLPDLVALLCLVLVFSFSTARAQDPGLKPVHLATGQITLETITPSEARIAPAGEFDGRYFKLIQFAQIPAERDRAAWTAAGLRLVDYLPDNTYFAVIPRDFDLGRLTGKALTVVDVADAFRLEPGLPALRAAGQSADRLTVSYYAGLDAERVMADLRARGVKIEGQRDYAYQLDIAIDPARFNEIIALPYLQFIGLPPDTSGLDGYDHRNATGRANYLNTGYNGLNYNGAGVVVGIGEGGTVDNLPDVKGRLTEMVTGEDPSDHKIGVMQNAAGAGSLDPTNRNNAWGATLLSVPTSPDYVGLYSSASLRYTNHSYGSPAPSNGYDSTARSHDLRIAAYPNHLVIYSSGNSGASTGVAPYPFATWATITGAYKENKNEFTVGALDPASDVVTSFSSRGPSYDGRIIPQVVVEGIEGTSDAAPKVTGMMAMLAQVFKDKNGGAEPQSTLLRAIMMNTADEEDDPGPDYKTGYGRPNMRRAYNAINNAQYLSGSISNGGSNTHTLVVPANTTQVRVMLIWPDVAAAVNANPAIVNNLNLLATDPGNTSYNPWVLDSTPTVAAIDAPATRGVDNLNTYEQVTVDNPAAGDWTIQVSGASVPQGPQAYFITYEFLSDELTMAFPLKDHRFASAGIYQLKWDSYGASGTFNLDYELDASGTWVNIATGYDATSRTYPWTAPEVSGVHTIKFRVQRGALSSVSEVNYIGSVPRNLVVQWVCGDAVKLSWDAAAGATAYKVYKLGSQYMEAVTTGVSFDGPSAILSGQSTSDTGYYAVGAVVASYEGLQTAAVAKPAGDLNCFNVKTTVAGSVGKTNVTFKGLVNPHGATLSSVHFEYGPTAAYGAVTPDVAISATGHTEEVVSSAVPSSLAGRADLLHFRLVAMKDGAPVYGDDRVARLAPGGDFTFDGVDDYIDLSSHSGLPVARRGAGTAYSVAMWVKASPTSSGLRLYSETSSSGPGRFALQTHTSGQIWLNFTDDAGTSVCNYLVGATALDGAWHHIAWVDSNGAGVLYVDGNGGNTLSCNTSNGLTVDQAAIGAALGSSASNFFVGRIDEVSLWDKALSAGEVRALMHQPLQGNEANLKAYYQLDSGTNRVFDAVTGQEATLSGGGTTTTATEPVGVGAEAYAAEASGAVTFTGTGVTANYSSQTGKTVVVSRIDVEPNTTSGITGNVTVFDNQYWAIHQASAGSFTANVTFTTSEDLTATDQSYPGQIQLYGRAAGSDGDWSFVTAATSVNAATDQATFNSISAFNKQFMLIRYLDPFLSASQTSLAFVNAKLGCGSQTLSYTLSGVHLTENVTVSASTGFQLSADGTNYSSGLTVTPASGSVAQTIYVRITSPAAGTYSGSLSNSSPGASTVTVTIPQFEILAAADSATKAMVFNGSTQYLDVLNYNWNPANAFTVEWWLKPTTARNYNQTIGNGWNSWVFHANTGPFVSSGTVNDTGSRIDSAAGLPTLNEWQHFAYVLNGTNARLYRNGELVGEKASSSGKNSAWGHFMIGAANANTIDGQIDELRMWSVARTQQQIKDNMHQVLAGNETGLKLYLQFNASGGVAEDYSSNCYSVATYNSPTRTLSTAPVGTVGQTVQTNSQTAVGDPGKRLEVTVSSPAQPSTTDYLGIYRTGDGSVKVTGESFPTGVIQRASILWGVRQFGSVTADLVIDYSQVPGVTNPAIIQLLKRTDAASAWTNVTNDWVRDDNARTFTKTGVTSFSEFAIGDNGGNPLAVELAGFLAQSTPAGVVLTWETVSEVDTAGFNLYRSPDGIRWQQLNPALIAGSGPGSAGGQSYTWTDTSAPRVRQLLYRLEVENLHGVRQALGTVAVDDAGSPQVWLPLVSGR